METNQMNLDWNYVVGFTGMIAGSIILSILGNLLTKFLFPDDGKQFMMTSIAVLVKTLWILAELLVGLALVGAFILWIFNAIDLKYAILLGFLTSFMMTYKLYFQELIV